MELGDDPAIIIAARAGVASGRYIEDDAAPLGLRKGPNYALPPDPEHAAMQTRLDLICEANDR